jgi:hypothetical protein
VASTRHLRPAREERAVSEPRVNVGHGLFSANSIHAANTTMWRHTNGIEPANFVIRSAARSWMFLRASGQDVCHHRVV